MNSNSDVLGVVMLRQSIPINDALHTYHRAPIPICFLFHDGIVSHTGTLCPLLFPRKHLEMARQVIPNIAQRLF